MERVQQRVKPSKDFKVYSSRRNYRPERRHTSDNAAARLQALSVLLSRARLMARLGQHYDGDRDLYEALGYPLTLTYDHYAAKYERQDIAKAIINRPINATWRGKFNLLESDDDEDTPLEKAWNELYKRLKLKSKFVRLDKLSCLGKYGILLLGLDDVKSTLDFSKPVNSGKRKLLYIKPYAEEDANILEWEKNTNSKRYGLPSIYQVSISNPGSDTSTSIRMHHSRVIHVAGELLKSETEGVPVLKAVFNRLMDIEKLTGGSAEMFWRGARPGYQGKTDPEYQMTPTMEDDLQNQIDEYEHNLRRILINEGIDLKALAMQVADPRPHIDVQIEMISAVTGIPKRILTGSERGELASTEDKGNWLDLIQSRREEHAEPNIIEPFVDRCIEYGVLPPAREEYSVTWPDLYAQSEKDKAETGKTRSTSIKEYTMSPMAEAIMPPEAFLKYCLGFDDKTVELIQEMREAAIREEQEEMKKTEEKELPQNQEEEEQQ